MLMEVSSIVCGVYLGRSLSLLGSTFLTLNPDVAEKDELVWWNGSNDENCEKSNLSNISDGSGIIILYTFL